jgi:hypothetical protein
MARRFDYSDYPKGMDRPAGPDTSHLQRPMEMRDTGSQSRGLLANGNAGATITIPELAEDADPLTYPLFEIRGDPSEPEPVTVFVSREWITAPGGDVDGEWSTDLALIAEWNVQHFNGRAEIDLMNGTMFSLMASTLKLSVRIALTHPDYGSGGSYRISAGVSHGIRPSYAPPQRTVWRDRSLYASSLNPGDPGSPFLIPPYARGVYPMALAAGDGQWCNFSLFQCASQSGFSLSQHLYTAGTVISPLRIPLINGARWILITNTDAVKSLIRPALIFDLAL